MNTATLSAPAAPTSGWDPAIHAEVRALARRLCRRNDFGITPDEVTAEALARLWRVPVPADAWDREGYLQARVRWSYKSLVRRAVAARIRANCELVALVGDQGRSGVHAEWVTSVDPVEDAEADRAAVAWIRDLQLAVTRRLAELGPRDEARARALAALLAQLAIAANGGALPEAVPERSDRLEAVERERCAAAWLADARLRAVPGGPDDAATRQRRRRLWALVREEVAELAPELVPVAIARAASQVAA